MIKNIFIILLILTLGLAALIIKAQVGQVTRGTQRHNKNVASSISSPITNKKFSCSYDSIASLTYNKKRKNLRYFFHDKYSNTRFDDYLYDISNKSKATIAKSANDYQDVRYLGEFGGQIEILAQGTGSFVNILDSTSEGWISELHSIDLSTGQAFLVRKTIKLDQSKITPGQEGGEGVEIASFYGTCN